MSAFIVSTVVFLLGVLWAIDGLDGIAIVRRLGVVTVSILAVTAFFFRQQFADGTTQFVDRKAHEISADFIAAMNRFFPPPTTQPVPTTTTTCPTLTTGVAGAVPSADDQGPAC